MLKNCSSIPLTLRSFDATMCHFISFRHFFPTINFLETPCYDPDTFPIFYLQPTLWIVVSHGSSYPMCQKCSFPCTFDVSYKKAYLIWRGFPFLIELLCFLVCFNSSILTKSDNFQFEVKILCKKIKALFWHLLSSAQCQITQNNDSSLEHKIKPIH